MVSLMVDTSPAVETAVYHRKYAEAHCPPSACPIQKERFLLANSQVQKTGVLWTVYLTVN